MKRPPWWIGWAVLYFCALAAMLTGCVQARIAAYERRHEALPCQVDMYQDGRYVGCVDRYKAQDILRTVSP